MSIWRKANNAVIRGTSGNPFECATCPCGSPPQNCPANCDACDPSTFILTISGFGGGCSYLNGTFTLNYYGGCFWADEFFIWTMWCGSQYWNIQPVDHTYGQPVFANTTGCPGGGIPASGTGTSIPIEPCDYSFSWALTLPPP